MEAAQCHGDVLSPESGHPSSQPGSTLTNQANPAVIYPVGLASFLMVPAPSTCLLQGMDENLDGEAHCSSDTGAVGVTRQLLEAAATSALCPPPLHFFCLPYNSLSPFSFSDTHRVSKR